MRRTGIHHLSFALGEKVWYRDLPDIEERILALNIPDEEDLWNWGWCRRSAGDYDEHVARGFTEAVEFIGGAGIAVDAVLACGPTHNDGDRFAAAIVRDVLPKIGVGAERLRRVDDRDCANVMQAVADARELIAAGADHVLILAAEKMEDERARFRKHSMFSDFSFALLLSSGVDRCGHEIADVYMGRDPHPGQDTSAILTRHLEKECVTELLARNGVERRDVAKLFYLNLFEPIAEMKGKDIGFPGRQLHTDEVKESGHCYGADPFINMHGYLAKGGNGTTHVLCASGRAYAGVSLVRRLR